MSATLFSFIKNRKFYSKLVSIFLLPTLILSLFSYYSLKIIIDSQLKDANMLYLNQTVNAFEIIVNQIENNSRQLIADNNFRSYEDFPMGNYYESISGAIADEDLPGLFSYLNDKKEIWPAINTLKFSNQFIDSVYFYDRQKDIIMTDKGIYKSFDKFHDKEWFYPLKQSIEFPYIMNTRHIVEDDGLNKDVITIVFKSFSQYENYVVINIDVNYLSNNILKKLDVNGDNKLFVLSRDGELLLYNGQYDSLLPINGMPYIKKASKDDKGIFISKENGKSVLVTYVTSRDLGWKFINVSELRAFLGNTPYLLKFTFTLFTVLILITIVFYLLSSRGIYRPISDIVENINKRKVWDSKSNTEDIETSNTRRVDEIEFIKDSLKTIYEEKDWLQVRLREAMPAYREKFILSLIRGNDYTEDYIIKIFRSLNVGIELNDLVSIVIAVDGFEKLKLSIKELSVYRIKVINIIEDKLKNGWNSIVVDEDGNNFITIVNCKKDEIGRIFTLSEEIKNEINKALMVDCSIGVGEWCSSIEGIKRSYDGAREALKHRLVVGSNEVIYVEDIRIKKVDYVGFPGDVINAMFDYIKSGNSQNARKVFFKITKDLAVNGKNIGYNNVQQLFIKLVTKTIDVVNEMGLDADSIFGENTTPYNEVLEKNNIEDLTKWFENIIDKVTENIDKAIVNKNNEYIDIIIDKLKQNCGYDISLNSIADELNLSPSYVSRIFKKFTNKTFVEYLTDIRIEVAKELLEKSDLTIKDIAEKTGYGSSYYFIKIFKERTGVTPGEYRKISRIKK